MSPWEKDSITWAESKERLFRLQAWRLKRALECAGEEVEAPEHCDDNRIAA